METYTKGLWHQEPDKRCHCGRKMGSWASWGACVCGYSMCVVWVWECAKLTGNFLKMQSFATFPMANKSQMHSRISPPISTSKDCRNTLEGRGRQGRSEGDNVRVERRDFCTLISLPPSHVTCHRSSGEVYRCLSCARGKKKETINCCMMDPRSGGQTHKYTNNCTK